MHTSGEQRDPLKAIRSFADQEAEPHILFHLESPEETPLADAQMTDLIRTLATCEAAMLRVFGDIREGVLSIDTVEGVADEEANVPLWSGILCVVGSYYDYAVSRLLSEEPLKIPLESPSSTSIRTLLEITQDPDAAEISAAAYFVARYFQVYLALNSFRGLANNPLGVPLAVGLLEYVHSPLGDMARFVRTDEAYPLGGFALQSIRSALANVSIVCRATSRDSSADLKKLMGLPKGLALQDLASRTQRAVHLLGEKNIETVFEQRLLFLMQSFGFLVSSARRGVRAVDLICISAAREPYTLLLEAKTSRRNYYLPTKDARALKEYILETQVALSTLPPLKLALVVGPAAASTMAHKIRLLEGDVGVPIRYCETSVLEELRNRLPGPVPATAFLSTLRLSEHVVNRDIVDAIAQDYEREQAIHNSFVQEMLSRNSILDRFLNRL